MRGSDGPLVQFRPPLRLVNVLVEAPFVENYGIGRVDKAGAGQLEVSNQCWMLHEPLVVFCPGGRQFPRGVNRVDADRIPTASKTSSALPR